jgi:hypothetical protein
LSTRYDDATGALIARAISRPGTWVYVAVPKPGGGARAARWLREHGIRLEATGAGGLTAYERAYQRSLYWVLNGGGGQRNAAWSVQREWGPVTAAGRMLGVRASRPATARRALARKPRSGQYWRNPQLRSGGEGSVQQRFG